MIVAKWQQPISKSIRSLKQCEWVRMIINKYYKIMPLAK